MVACEPTNNPSSSDNDRIDIEMGGVYSKYNGGLFEGTEQTQIGKVWIYTGLSEDKKDLVYKEFEQGCHTEFQEKYIIATDFILAEDKEWYYITKINERIKKNPENGEMDGEWTYNKVENGWKLTRFIEIISYDEEAKTITRKTTNNVHRWVYSWD